MARGCGSLAETPVSPSTPVPPVTPSAPAPKKPKTAPAKAPTGEKASPAAPKPPKSTAPASPKPTVAPRNPTRVVPAKPVPPPPKGTVIDASGLVLGRAASVIAQRLLKGEDIIVVNSEKSVVTGSRKNVLNFYIANRARGSVRSGPHYPRYPDRIFRRTVRGMLPHLKTRGKEAFDRLQVFIGVPSHVSPLPRQSIDVAKARPSLTPPLTLEEITRLLGARV